MKWAHVLDTLEGFKDEVVWRVVGKRRAVRAEAERQERARRRRHDAILDGTLVQLEHSDVWLHVHPPDRCLGEDCTVHRRSEHHMRGWPQHWRSDRGLMERICPDNGIGHPDPDSPPGADTVHGCDGCCHA